MRWVALLTFVNGAMLVPFIVVMAVVGAYVSEGQWQNLVVLVVLSAVGYGLLRFNWPRAPFVIGLVLGKIAEESLHKALGLWGTSFFTRPLSLRHHHRLRGVPVRAAARRPATAGGVMKSIPAPMTFLMLAIFTAMVAVAATYPADARFMPFVVGIPAIGLCLLQLVLDLYRRRMPAAVDGRSELEKAQDEASRAAGRQIQFEMPSENALFTEGEFDPKERVRRELVAWGYFLGLIASVLLFGFRFTVPVFLIAFLRLQAGTSWRSAVLYGGGGALLMYLLFEKLLKVTLHSGFVTDWILERLGS
jgi:hypothetical protein